MSVFLRVYVWLIVVDVTLLGHSWVVTSVCLSADGTKVASGSEDGTVKIWNVETGQVLQTLEGGKYTKLLRVNAFIYG